MISPTEHQQMLLLISSSNRLLLRKVMKSQQFRQLPTEWWHYNAYSRDVARGKYSVLKEEPVLDLKP